MAVTFLTVLVSIIIAVSMANLRMKQVEYRIKKNFYSNEQIVSDVYNGIGKESTLCFSKAYSSILSQTINDGGKIIYQSEDEAFEAFSRNFIVRLTEKFEEGAQKDDTLELLNKYSIYSAVSTKVKQYDEIEVVKNAKGIPTELVIRGIVVNYKETDSAGNTTGYESSITTDIVIEVPYVTFFEDSSRILDYALIGNKGVYFRDGDRDVLGNVYAGIDTDEPIGNITNYRNEDVYGGLNFYKANINLVSSYIISKGDINIRECEINIKRDSDSDGDTQIWAETLRTVESRDKNEITVESRLNIEGQTFIANDLELNARNSNVTLEGEYYGYNNRKYETQEKKNLTSTYKDLNAVHTQSSAVIINGNSSSLDLSGLNMFVVSGVAYIDFVNGNFPDGGETGIEEYATGESLALKTNQSIYLAPQECLTGMNPCLSEEADSVVWAEGSNWFAHNKRFLNPTAPIEQKMYGRNGKKYVYHYLNFISDDKKKEYTELVLNMTEPDKMAAEMPEEVKSLYVGFEEIELEQIWEVKQAVQAKAKAVGSIIKVADGVDTKIYTRGSIVQVSDDKESTQYVESDKWLSDDYIGKIDNNLLKHYQHLYTYLDPKEDFSLLSNALEFKAFELDDTKPFSKFVDAGKIMALSINEYKCTGKYGKCKTIISKENYTITNNLSGIVICSGDVTVESGVQVEGLILSAGRIYIKGNGKIEAGRSVIQNMIEEEYAEEAVKEDGEERNLSFVSTYLKDYGVKQKGAAHKERITGTDYTDYISYRNWKKGEGN